VNQERERKETLPTLVSRLLKGRWKEPWSEKMKAWEWHLREWEKKSRLEIVKGFGWGGEWGTTRDFLLGEWKERKKAVEKE
jgi:hypothetical protein